MAKKKKSEAKKLNIEKTIKTTKNRGLFIGIGIAALFIMLFLFYSYSKNNFDYAELRFSRVSFGDLLFYHAKIPLMNSNNEITGYYPLYIRNDPRELESIPINGEIRLKSKVIAASDYLKCEDNGIAGGELGGIIGLWAKVIPGSMNKSLAAEKDIAYASCNAREIIHLDASTIILVPGNTTEISQKGADCYEISVKDCEVLKATERFILGLYAHSRGIDIN